MKTVVSSALLLLVVGVAIPVSANHDQGQGKSQDHLHRQDSIQAVEVPEPSSAILLTVGAVLFVGAAAFRVFGRRKPTNA